MKPIKLFYLNKIILEVPHDENNKFYQCVNFDCENYQMNMFVEKMGN